MTKKRMIINLVDGSEIVRDLGIHAIQAKAPLGAGADNQFYLAIGSQALMGILETETATKYYAKLIAASQIKSVEIKFGDE